MRNDEDEHEHLMREVRRHQRPNIEGVQGPESLPTVIPPILYLPVRESSDGENIAEIRPTPDGRQMLVAYTALDRLVERCGPAQQWVLVQAESIASIKQQQPFDAVSFDPYFAEPFLRDGRLA